MNEANKPRPSLGDWVRQYVARKFGENERGSLVVDHETLRYVICDCATQWINLGENGRPENDDER